MVHKVIKVLSVRQKDLRVLRDLKVQKEIEDHNPPKKDLRVQMVHEELPQQIKVKKVQKVVEVLKLLQQLLLMEMKILVSFRLPIIQCKLVSTIIPL